MGPSDLPCASGDELELIRPSIYRNVARQLSLPLQSESAVTEAFLAVAAQIFVAGRSGCPLQGAHGPVALGACRAAGAEPPVVLVGQWQELLARVGLGVLHMACGSRAPHSQTMGGRAGPVSGGLSAVAGGVAGHRAASCRIQPPPGPPPSAPAPPARGRSHFGKEVLRGWCRLLPNVLLTPVLERPGGRRGCDPEGPLWRRWCVVSWLTPALGSSWTPLSPGPRWRVGGRLCVSPGCQAAGL